METALRLARPAHRDGVAGRNEAGTRLFLAGSQSYRDTGHACDNGYRSFVCVEAIKSASIEPVRRFLSIFLLAMFGLPFVSPLLALTATSQSNLPACCRRNGRHHCVTTMSERAQLANHDPQFQTPVEKCPYCPAAVAVIHGDTFAPSGAQAIFARLVAHPAVVAQTQSKLRISRSRSRQKRGPPVSLAL